MKKITLFALGLFPAFVFAQDNIDKCLQLLESNKTAECKELASVAISKTTSLSELDQWRWLVETRFTKESQNQLLMQINKASKNYKPSLSDHEENKTNNLDQFYGSMQQNKNSIYDNSHSETWKWLLILAASALTYQQLKDKSLEITRW